jgi:hypothetical protein
VGAPRAWDLIFLRVSKGAWPASFQLQDLPTWSIVQTQERGIIEIVFQADDALAPSKKVKLRLTESEVQKDVRRRL